MTTCAHCEASRLRIGREIVVVRLQFSSDQRREQVAHDERGIRLGIDAKTILNKCSP